jgi:predicted MFS family arabinose efflux permease
MEMGIVHSSNYPKEPLFTGSFLLLLASSLLLQTGMGVFYLFPLFVLDIGGNKADIGILMGAMSLAAVCGRPWISGLVDRIGRKRGLVTSSLLLMVVSAIHLFFNGPIDQTFPFLMILRLIFGTGLALSFVSGLSMAADLAPASRLTEGIGYFGITPLVGIALGPVVAEGLIRLWGFNAMFFTALGIFMAAFLALMPMRDQFMRSLTPDTAVGDFFKVLKIPLVWRMTVICVCFGVAFAAHSSFVAPFAQKNALSISAYFASYSVAAVFARISGGYLANRFGEIRVMPAALVMASVGFFSLIGVSTTTGLMGTGFLAGMGHGLLFPSLISVTLYPTSAGNRGKVSGALTGGFDAGVFIGALVMGQLGELYGFSTIFVMAAAFIILGLGIFYRIRPTIVRR